MFKIFLKNGETIEIARKDVDRATIIVADKDDAYTALDHTCLEKIIHIKVRNNE